MFLINPFIYGAWTNLKSVSMDGVDEYIALSSAPSLVVSATNFTVSTWIKNSNVDCSPVSFFNSAVSNTGPFRMFINSVDTRLQVGIRNGSNAIGYINGFGTSASWRNVVVVYDGGGTLNSDRLKIYVDDVLQTLTFSGTIPSSTSATSPNEFWFGRSGSTYMNGNIDETALFDYSLSASEVTALYNSGCPNNLMSLAAAKRPEHYWRMGDDDTYSTINDIGETGGKNGTMTNQEIGDITTDTPC